MHTKSLLIQHSTSNLFDITMLIVFGILNQGMTLDSIYLIGLSIGEVMKK